MPTRRRRAGSSSAAIGATNRSGRWRAPSPRRTTCSRTACSRRRSRPNDAPTTYTFDPRNPVPTLGGNVSSQGTLMFQGAADQRCRPDFWLCTDTRPLSARNDVLVFQTPPLTPDRGHRPADREAVGHVERARYGFHGQADRRVSAQPRLPRRRGSQHRRQHRARPLSRTARARRSC